MKIIAFYAVSSRAVRDRRHIHEIFPRTDAVISHVGARDSFQCRCIIQAWAMKHEALGSSYAVVLGLEALLAVVAGSIIFSEEVTMRILCGVTLVVLGIVVLRLN